MTEQWRPVVGFEGRYEVSDQGRVRSLRFRGNGDSRLMSAPKNRAGYRVLTLGVDRRQFRLHVLVLEAFVGPRPDGAQGCHNDSNKENNSAANLRWDSPAGNIADRASIAGDKNPNAKLSEAQRSMAVKRVLAGESSTDVAVSLGVTRARVRQLVRAASEFSQR